MRNSLILCLLAFGITAGFAQKSMVIGTNVTDKPNAILVLNPPGGDQGFLLPQLTTAARVAITPTSPAEDGLVVYDITQGSFYYWNSGAWKKGLGGGSQTLNYNAATQTLTLSDGNTISLSELKEIPEQTSHAGKFLTTNGTALSWATTSSLGDITSVTAGSALTGGGTTGDITFGVNTDGTTIAVNGSNQLHLADNAVTNNKLNANAVTSTKIADLTIGTIDIADGAITDTKIASVSPSKITGATASTGQVLKWNGSAWTPQSDNGTGTVTQIIAGTGLSGGTITTSGTLALTNTGVTANSYGSGTQIPVFAVDAQGRITNAGTVAITGAVPTGSAGGDLEGNYPNPAVKNDAITSAKLADNAVTSIKIADGTIQTADLFNGAVTSLKIEDGTILTADLNNNAVTDAKIAAGVSPSKLSGSGATAGQVLKWSGSSWTPQNENAGITSITASGGLDGGTITTTGTISLADGGVTNAKLASGSITSDKIVNGTIATADLADDAVTSLKLSSTGVTANTYGSATQVPVFQVDAKGRISGVTNTTISGAAPSGSAGGDLTGTYPNPTIANNAVGSAEITDGTISTNDLADAAVTSLKLADASVNSNKIQDASIATADLANAAVTTGKINAGANNTILSTNGSGVVTWTNQIATSSLAASGATAGNLLVFNGTNWVAENAAVDGTTIAGAGIPANPFRIRAGSANQVLITNAGNNVAWVNQSTLASSLAASGDVTGALNNTVVARLQGNPVDNAVLAAGDNGKALVWNGAEWIATTVAGITASTSYYSIDPADFQSVRNAGKKDEDNIIIFEENTEFVTILKRNEAKNIIAPIHLPDGAVMTQVTAFYMDDATGSINVRIFRKNFSTGTKSQIATITSSNNSSAIISQSASMSETINNNLNSYRIEIELNPDSDINNFSDATHRIYGFRVTYTK